MTRSVAPHNQALQDRIIMVLKDACPDPLTSSQIAERVGGMKTFWQTCGCVYGHACRVAEEADPAYRWTRRTNAEHHPPERPGRVAQDSWEVSWNAMDMNAPLNRLARDLLVMKIKDPALRAVLWKWRGDPNEHQGLVTDLEALIE